MTLSENMRFHEQLTGENVVPSAQLWFRGLQHTIFITPHHEQISSKFVAKIFFLNKKSIPFSILYYYIWKILGNQLMEKRRKYY